MTRLTRPATGTAARPCPSSDLVGLHPVKARTLRFRLPLSSLRAGLCMSLALLTLGLLSAPPVQAQGNYPGSGSGSGYPGGGPPPDPGHYWSITYDHSNTISKHFVRDVPAAGQMTPTQSAGGSTIINGDDEDTITATLTWVPAAGQDKTSDPPPSKVHLREAGYAWEASLWGGPGSAPSGAGTADDGLGDPVNASGTSQGIHLIQRDGSSGTITLDPVTLKAINPVSTWQLQSGYPGGGSGGGYPGGGGTYHAWDWTGGEDSISFHVIVDVSDARSVMIYREGAHDEPPADADGTMHGDTRFSYAAGSGLGGVTVENRQEFHSRLLGVWTDPSWQWAPQGFSPPDNIDTHYQIMDAGSVMADNSPQQWFGQPDVAKSITISYTATDSGASTDGASATAKYILTLHDQYEKWHRVSSQGGQIDPNSMGDHGGLTELAHGDNNVPGTIALTVQATPIQWNADESFGGGFVAAAGTVCTLFGKIPTWGGIVLTLAGLALQTAASVPPDATSISPPAQFTASFLQTAFQNYKYNQTAYPGEENNSNITDTNFAQYLAKNPDFQGYYAGDYGSVSVTTTLFAQMLDYYFQADKYDNGGLVTHTAPGSVTRPGGNVWEYLWHCAGTPQQPGASSMPSL